MASETSGSSSRSSASRDSVVTSVGLSVRRQPTDSATDRWARLRKDHPCNLLFPVAATTVAAMTHFAPALPARSAAAKARWETRSSLVAGAAAVIGVVIRFY